ncbi:MAG: tetratricopeptide repeat protein [Pseudomonadota bacterium]|nr:tetratricopeptide repeat protein [Pseudomonadota bacterium]
MNAPTNWVPGVIVLLVALAVGIVVVLRSRQGAAFPAPERTRREELERQKDALYGLLREHNTQQANAGPAEWAAERDRLELDAARVLRDLDALGRPDAAPAAATPGFGTRNPKLVGALWGAGAMLFLGGLGLTLQEFATPRPEGGTMTGNAAGGTGAEGEDAPLSPAQEAELARLRAAAEAAPTDVAARNALAHALLHAGKLMDAYQESEAVVALSAEDPEARTHQAIVLIAIGDVAMAAKALDRVLAGAPEFSEALAYRGALHFQAGEREQAIAVLDRAILADPALAASVQPLIEAARAGKGPMASAGGASAGGSSGTASGGGPMSGGGAASGAREASPDDVTGTIALDAAVASLAKPGDTLFLSARPPGATAGPPTWVKRVQVDSFPIPFTLGPAENMIGSPTPPEFVITARIDRDGNAKTKSPDDLEGRTPTLKPGATGVVITLAAAGP